MKWIVFCVYITFLVSCCESKSGMNCNENGNCVKLISKAFRKVIHWFQDYFDIKDKGETIKLKKDWFDDNRISVNPNEPFKLQSGSVVYKWSAGIVPYYIDPDYYDGIISARIVNAIKMVEQASCLEFKQMSSINYYQPDTGLRNSWLVFTNPQRLRECVHEVSVGDRGQTIVTLGFDCINNRDIIHALLHGLGFHDEVTHPQRDSYISVIWHNIQPQYRKLFMIRKNTTAETLVEYDTLSVMHFHDLAYSSNGGATVVSKIPGLEIEPTDKLSQLDITKLHAAFGHYCNKKRVAQFMKKCNNNLQPDNIRKYG